MQTTTLRLRTTGPDDTRALGAAIAELLQPGDAVALSGELGAGKTCLVQGAVAGLGIEARVTSPTFVLVRLYDGGRIPVVHCDVYRLDRLHDVDDLGDDVLAPDVVTFVEWADAVAALLPGDRLDVDVQLGDDSFGDDGFGDGVVAGGVVAGGAGVGDVAGDEAAGGDGTVVDDAAAAVDGAVDGERLLTITARGAWVERARELARVSAPWRDVRSGGDA